jgi:glycosyltransferase involved in cell wall biosynthesis
MDWANYELAWYLADEIKADVHLVSYYAASPLVDHPRVTWHKVPKPLGMRTIGDLLLRRIGRRIARTLSASGARVVVNGGNCDWPDGNWVHAVHAAWNTRHNHAPLAFRLRSGLAKRAFRRAERRSLRAARIIFANSDLSRRQVIEHIGVSPEQVHTVYCGIDSNSFHPFSQPERELARQRLGLSKKPLVAFVGALGHDRNKGFDLVFEAWKQLCRDPDWDVDLIAVGEGAEVAIWRRQAAEDALGERVRLLGFTREIRDVMAAVDALVSPTHYDAYGMAVQEALCCGIPAFVTRSAGIAERYPAELADLLLDDPPQVEDLVSRLRFWRADIEGYRRRVAPFGELLRQRSWTDMASEIFQLMESCSEAQTPEAKQGSR